MIPLPIIDMRSAVVGTTGSLSLNNVGVSASGSSANPAHALRPAHIVLFNESGCGLALSFTTSTGGINLPAGGWIILPIPLGESEIKFTVLYILTNSGVSQILATYYYPGEPVPQTIVLGNSPISGGVTSLGNYTALPSPINVATNDSITSGTTKAYTCTGATTGVPVNATSVDIVCLFNPIQANDYLAFSPHGTVWNANTQLYPVAGPAGAGSSSVNTVSASFLLKLDSNGQIDVKAVGNNLVAIFLAVKGYIV